AIADSTLRCLSLMRKRRVLVQSMAWDYQSAEFNRSMFFGNTWNSSMHPISTPAACALSTLGCEHIGFPRIG
ncbi:MAG: hypothetical protein KA932_14150, partial [Giesbergeria sp.]|nr:hypothetical protein [Giesbergeria sp.]